MSIKRFVRVWVPVIAWMVLIFAGSTDVLSAEHTSRFLVPFLRWLDPQISFQTIAAIHFGIRKLGHLTEYGILAMLLWRALRDALRSTSAFAIIAISLGVCALFAMSDEFHQSFVPSRTASENDVMIDICGALAGLTICLLFARRKAPALAQDRHSGPERI